MTSAILRNVLSAGLVTAAAASGMVATAQIHDLAYPASRVPVPVVVRLRADPPALLFPAAGCGAQRPVP